MPYGGTLGKAFLYRKDLLDKNNLPYPTNDWNWNDLFRYCKKITDPENGTYGLYSGKGINESWFWVTFLWSAGGDVLRYNPRDDKWSTAITLNIKERFTFNKLYLPVFLRVNDLNFAVCVERY